MKSINLRIDRELFLALKTNKITSGIPVQEQIRRAIRFALFADAQHKVETRDNEVCVNLRRAGVVR